jgi:hypothetical protein
MGSETQRYEMTPLAESREIFIKQFHVSAKFALVADPFYTLRLSAS